MRSIFVFFAFLLFPSLFFAQSYASVDTTTAYQLIREGELFVQKKQLQPALDRYKQSLALLAAAPADGKSVQCLSGICVCYNFLSELDSLNLYAERGLQLSQSLYDAGQAPTEDFSRHKANYFRLLQQYPSSIAWQHRALAYLLQNFPDRTSLIASGYGDLGVSYMETGQFDSAMVVCTEMLRLLRSLPQEDAQNQIKMARGLQNVGILYKELGRFEEAIEAYGQALQICEEQHDEDLGARVVYNLGFAIELQGDVERSLDYYQKASEVFLKLYGESSPFYATALNKVASVNARLGNFDTAWAQHQKAIAINTAKFSPQHPKIAITKLNLSIMLSKMGRFRESAQAARESVDIFEHNFPTANPQKASAYGNLAMQYFNAGLQHDSIDYFLEKCLADSRLLYGDRSEITAVALAEKSICLDNPQHRLEALKTIQEALIAATRTFNSLDVRENPAPDDFFQVDESFAKLQSKALILAELWEDHHRREDLELSLQCLEHGNTVMQQQLRKINGQNASDFSATEAWGFLCKDAIRISTQCYQAYPTPENLEQCFRWIERDKAKKLLLASKDAQAKTYAGLPDSLLRRDAQLARQLTNLEQQLAQAEQANDSAAIFQIRNEYLFAAKEERMAFVRDLERDYPAYFSLKYQISTTSLKEVQQQLPPSTLLLEYAFGKMPNDSTLYLLAIGKDSAILAQKHLLTGLADKVARLNSLLQNQSLMQAARRKEFAKISSDLYAQFIQPIEPQLKGIEKIIFVGEGITHLLPFEVLLPTVEDKPFQQMDFLLRRFEISYHYSATLWANSPAPADDYAQDLFAFAPIFDAGKSGNSLFVSSLKDRRDSTLRAFSSDGQWAPLPWTEKEVRSIAQAFQSRKKGKTMLLLREEADEQNLKTGLERGARCIHIASHSFANVQQPKFSGIACSLGKSEQNDGTLFVGELYNLRIQADLVTLSSCESGKGKLLQTEGQLGLNRAFLYTGVPNVLFSLWKINDQVTSDLMSHFYRSMLQGQSYSAALRNAKLKMLSDPTTATPNLWSGFLLIGK